MIAKVRFLSSLHYDGMIMDVRLEKEVFRPSPPRHSTCPGSRLEIYVAYPYTAACMRTKYVSLAGLELNSYNRQVSKREV